MKSGILKTLEEITGDTQCTGLDMYMHGCHSYNYVNSLAGKRLSFIQDDGSGLVYIIERASPVPLVWFKDIQEVKEPTDWTKVKVDTKFTGWNNNNPSIKHRQYFAKYEDGKVCSFPFGKTSWTNDNIYYVSWDNAELAEEV